MNLPELYERRSKLVDKYLSVKKTRDFDQLVEVTEEFWDYSCKLLNQLGIRHEMRTRQMKGLHKPFITRPAPVSEKNRSTA